MAMITLDCARCGAQRMTHDVVGFSQYRDEVGAFRYEYAVTCRTCKKAAIWEITPGNSDPLELLKSNSPLDPWVNVVGLIRPTPESTPAPEHTPADLKLIFDEGAECISIGAWNAASAMFRKILDQISKDKMNNAPNGPPADKRTRFNLKPRLEWLFANNLLPRDVEALADCIREDANDAVHNAPLGEDDALDIQDFTVEMLEALFTLPGRLREAEARRATRRGQGEVP